MAYTDQAKIEGLLDTTLDARTAGQVSFWIAAVEEWIDNYVGSTFSDNGTETKYYDGNGKDCLVIDPCISVATLIILNDDGTTNYTLTEGAGNDFLLYPLNSEQKTMIKLLRGQVGIFRSGERRVSVEGVFRSYNNVPSVISLVATKLVSKIISQQGGKDVKREQLGDYEIEYSDVAGNIDEVADSLGVYNILNQYKVYSL